MSTGMEFSAVSNYPKCVDAYASFLYSSCPRPATQFASWYPSVDQTLSSTKPEHWNAWNKVESRIYLLNM